MASENHRDFLVECQTDDSEVTVSATRDRIGESVVLHLCNPSSAMKSVSFDFAGKGSGGYSLAKAVSLSAPCLDAVNTPDDPCRVSPKDVTEELRSKQSLRPYSYTVVEFRNNGKGRL